MDRRKFLKVAGLTGLGSVAAGMGLPVPGGQMVPGAAEDDYPSQLASTVSRDDRCVRREPCKVLVFSK